MAEAKAEYLYVSGNLADRDDRRRLVEEAVRRFQRIDVLVNNAGVAPKERKDLLDMTEESFDRVIGINTKGNLFLTQLVAKQMLTQLVIGKKRGTIINVSSCSAAVSSVNRGEYCISKAGVSMLTTLFADRLAGEGIVVNEVRPGVIATDMTATVKEKYDKLIAAGEFRLRDGESRRMWQMRSPRLPEMISFIRPETTSMWTGFPYPQTLKSGERGY
jgi:3-oxoacyl-[acyl-carrier protein] reductase